MSELGDELGYYYYCDMFRVIMYTSGGDYGTVPSYYGDYLWSIDTGKDRWF